MDCNGRSGRALWLWQTVKRTGRVPPDGFLRTWNENVGEKASFARHRRAYYQSLSDSRAECADDQDWSRLLGIKNPPGEYQ